MTPTHPQFSLKNDFVLLTPSQKVSGVHSRARWRNKELLSEPTNEKQSGREVFWGFAWLTEMLRNYLNFLRELDFTPKFPEDRISRAPSLLESPGEAGGG